MFLVCAECSASLEPEDGHDRFPRCLGIDHLRQGLTERACVDCSCLSLAARAARLAQLVEAAGSQLACAQDDPDQAPRSQRRRRASALEQQTGGAPKCAKSDPLAQKVDSLASEFAQIKELLKGLKRPDIQPASDSATVEATTHYPVLSPTVTAP